MRFCHHLILITLVLLSGCTPTDSDGSSGNGTGRDARADGSTDESDLDWSIDRHGDRDMRDSTDDGDCSPTTGPVECCDGDMAYGSPVCRNGRWVCPEGSLFPDGCPSIWHGDLSDADTTDAWDAGICEETELPPSEPSRQTVTFRFTNNSGETRYVASAAMNCEPFSIFRLLDDATSFIARSIGFTCPCECPAPPPPHVAQYLTVAAGDTVDLTWDARGITVHNRTVDCGEQGWPGMGCVSEPTGVAAPVAAGHYSVEFIVESTVPYECWEGEDLLNCDAPYDEPSMDFGSVNRLCSSSENPSVSSAELDLPETGDITVEIALD